MKLRYLALVALLAFLAVPFMAGCAEKALMKTAADKTATDVKSAAAEPASAPEPVFDDPVWHGAADPSVIWSHKDRKWYMFYTQRRASLENSKGVEHCHGTAIGMAVSEDGGKTWTYDGVCKGLDVEDAPNTYWAPDVIRDGDTYYLFVTYCKGVPTQWGAPKHVVQYRSDGNLSQWVKVGDLPHKASVAIDPDVRKIGDTWYCWYKCTGQPAQVRGTWVSESKDLKTWTEIGVAGEAFEKANHEAPNVFRWQDAWWMTNDSFGHLPLYRSADGRDWKLVTRIKGAGSHPEVVVSGGRAYVFFFRHLPGARLTRIYVGELVSKDGSVGFVLLSPNQVNLSPE